MLYCIRSPGNHSMKIKIVHHSGQTQVQGNNKDCSSGFYLIIEHPTFSRWGSAGVCSSTGVLVSLHAAGAAPASPAPSAGPHAARGAARVGAWLTHSSTTALCSTLSSRASRTHPCWTSAKARQKLSVRLLLREQWRVERLPTVLSEEVLDTLYRLWCFWLGGVTATGSVSSSADLTIPHFPIWFLLPLWHHKHIVLRGAAEIMKYAILQFKTTPD